jgi:L-ascorbate metabolism protein UlaG (beta-lactamase superfamily)
MDIEWFGDSSFRLRTATGTVVIDPDVGLGSHFLLESDPDIIVYSRGGAACDAPSLSDGGAFVVTGPGEYEVRGIFIMGVRVDDGPGGPGSDGSSEPGRQGHATAYAIDADELTVCHASGLARMPAQKHVEALGSVDVLLVPVGGGPVLDPDQAAELVGQVEPSVIVPTHYRGPGSDGMALLDRFLSEMGVEAPEPLDVLKIAANRLPLEPKVVLLQPRS